MKLSLDETVFGRKCYWMKTFLDESVFYQCSHIRMPCPNHGNAVRPAGPESWTAGPHYVPQSQTAQRQRHRGRILRVLGQKNATGQKKRKRDKISNRLSGQNKKLHPGQKKHKRDKEKRHLGQNKNWQTGQKTWVRMDNHVKKGVRGVKAGVRAGKLFFPRGRMRDQVTIANRKSQNMKPLSQRQPCTAKVELNLMRRRG